MDKYSRYFGAAAGVVMAVGLLGKGVSCIYDGTTNERLRTEYYTINDERINLERQIELYESRLKCIENPQECGPPDVIEVEVVPPLEVRTETDAW